MTHKITNIVSQREWTPPDGDTTKKTIYWNVKVDGLDKTVNFGRKPGNDPKVGDTLDGTFEDDDRGGLKFKKANNFGGGGTSESDKRAMRRSHAQEMALMAYTQLRHDAVYEGAANEREFFEAINRLVGIFERNVQAAVDA